MGKLPWNLWWHCSLNVIAPPSTVDSSFSPCMLWGNSVGAVWLAMHRGGWATFGLLVTGWCQRADFLYLEIRLFPTLTGLWAPGQDPSGAVGGIAKTRPPRNPPRSASARPGSGSGPGHRELRPGQGREGRPAAPAFLPNKSRNDGGLGFIPLEPAEYYGGKKKKKKKGPTKETT